MTIVTTTAVPEAVFANRAFRDHEQVVYCSDADTGLRSIIAVHSTALGPALGGVRFYPYGSEADALSDVLRLSEGMSFKAALAGLDLGGGKAVIIGDPRRIRTDALMRAFGRFVHGLAGRYVTAEDVGTTEADMDMIATETPYVTGTSAARNGLGDPSPATALGVFTAMQAVARRWGGGRSLSGLHVAVAGVGKVGSALAGRLVEAGATLTVADVDGAAAARVAAVTGAVIVAAEVIHRTGCDIYAPCALGGVLNERTIPELRCRAVVGAANNQLADEVHARQLVDAGVVYVPDFVANAGGLILVAAELHGDNRSTVETRIKGIHDTVLGVLTAADDGGLTTSQSAMTLARQRMDLGEVDLRGVSR